jgi:hypothetical protein
MASNKVSKRKKPIKSIYIIAVNFTLTLNSNIKRSVNSTIFRQTPKNIEKGCIKPIPKEIKYSSILMAEAIGSMAFDNPEKINKAANNNLNTLTQISSFCFLIVLIFNYI